MQENVWKYIIFFEPVIAEYCALAFEATCLYSTLRTEIICTFSAAYFFNKVWR